MPIERATYRRYKGKRTNTTMRIISFSLSDFFSRMKRPAVIVVVCIFAAFVVLMGLLNIMGSIFSDENIFLDDPNPGYNRTVVGQIEVDSVSILSMENVS
jgi:hypothetical protein